MFFLDWCSVTGSSLQRAGEKILMFVPNLFGAFFVFIVGWFVSVWIGKLITNILNKLKFNQVFERGDWKTALEKAELKVDASDFVGDAVKWVLTIVFLDASAKILGLTQFAVFLTDILGYLGSVIVAALIFVVTVVVTDRLVKIIVAAGEGAKFEHSHLAGEIVRWAIWVFAILAILHQLGIARPLVEILFTGVVATLVISIGLAFGLGGKETAADILNSLKKKIKE